MIIPKNKRVSGGRAALIISRRRHWYIYDCITFVYISNLSLYDAGEKKKFLHTARPFAPLSCIIGTCVRGNKHLVEKKCPRRFQTSVLPRYGHSGGFDIKNSCEHPRYRSCCIYSCDIPARLYMKNKLKAYIYDRKYYTDLTRAAAAAAALESEILFIARARIECFPYIFIYARSRARARKKNKTVPPPRIY